MEFPIILEILELLTTIYNCSTSIFTPLSNSLENMEILEFPEKLEFPIVIYKFSALIFCSPVEFCFIESHSSPQRSTKPCAYVSASSRRSTTRRSSSPRKRTLREASARVHVCACVTDAARLLLSQSSHMHVYVS